MKKRLRDSSIQTKLLSSHLLLIVIPTILILGLFTSTLYDLIVNDSIRQAFALSRQSAAALEARLSPISSISAAIRTNTLVRQVCTDSVSEEEKEQLLYNNALLSDLHTLLSEDLVDNDTLITSIHLYTDHAPEGLYDNWLLQDFFLPESGSHGTYWHGIMSSTVKTELYCPPFYLSHSEISSYGPLAYIELLYPSSSSAAASPSYLAIYFSDRELEAILKQNESVEQGVSYIINERQSIVASSDLQLTGTYLMDYDTVRQISSAKDGFLTRNIMGENVYAAGYHLGNTDWYMASIIPSDIILMRGQNLIRNFALIYLLTLGIAFWIALQLSRSITKRLSAINGKMREARSAPPVRVGDPKLHDEIGELTDSYNFMADQLNLLVKRQQETAEELRVSEIRALQAQINPHFLYNTMDMINWLSQSGEQKEVTRAIQALSSFYKLTLSRKELMTDLDSEIKHVELYVELQNMRYEEKIGFVKDIPEDLLSVQIPKLTLQPIVENAILHGILEKESREGTIVLAGWMEEKDVVLLISDDGVGMEEDTLSRILSGEGGSSKGTNIAVSNTHKRLQMLYGEGYGLSYRSRKNEGTEVEIRLPRETGEADTDTNTPRNSLSDNI